MKTDAAGAAGVFVGVAAGEYVGGVVGRMAAPSGTVTQQHTYSAATKLGLGIVLLIVNSMTGLAGVFLLGISWGLIGSTVTDVFAVAKIGGLQGLAEQSAASMSKSYKAALASGVSIERARNKGMQNTRRPIAAEAEAAAPMS